MVIQLLHWVDMGGTVIEALLLTRMLHLKLGRMYMWLTLYWAVSVIFDSGSWALGFESRQSNVLTLYSLFVYGAVFPLAAWDCFEEMKAVLGKLRLVQGARMISGLFAALLIGAILFAVIGMVDNEVTFLDLAPITWLVSAFASLFFLANLRYLVKKQNLPIPRNTGTWVDVLIVLLGCQVVNFFTGVAPKEIAEPVALILSLISVGATAWALIRLRAVPSDTSASSEASAPLS